MRLMPAGCVICEVHEGRAAASVYPTRFKCRSCYDDSLRLLSTGQHAVMVHVNACHCADAKALFRGESTKERQDIDHVKHVCPPLAQQR